MGVVGDGVEIGAWVKGWGSGAVGIALLVAAAALLSCVLCCPVVHPVWVGACGWVRLTDLAYTSGDQAWVQQPHIWQSHTKPDRTREPELMSASIAPIGMSWGS